MTEFELFQALRPHYPAREYALLPQAANGTGAGAFRHCDALALGLWPSRGMYLHGFEIKSYRGDWMRELRNPEKAEEIARHCNYWWIVAAGPFVKGDELPETWGLMTWDEKKGVLVKTKHAPCREALPVDLPFVAAMLRKAQEVVTPTAAIEEARAAGLEAGRKEVVVNSRHDLERYAVLLRRVREIEKISGVKIDSWIPARQVGEAINQVLAGTIVRERAELRKTAARILEELGAEDSISRAEGEGVAP